MHAGSMVGLPPAFFRSIASSLVSSPYVVDDEGKSRDDYEQDLMEFALRTFGGKVVDVGLARASVRRHAIDAWRKRTRRAALREKFLPSEYDAAYSNAASTRAVRDLENRACTTLLERRMSAPNKRVLGALSLFGWKSGASAVEMSLPTFKRRIAVARVEAKSLLQGEENTMGLDPQKASDAELLAKFSCYGFMFSKGEQQCSDCLVRDRCIGVITQKTIPGLRIAGQTTVPQLAEALGSSSADVELLFQIEKGKPISELLPPQAGGPVVAAPAPKPSKKKAPPAPAAKVESVEPAPAPVTTMEEPLVASEKEVLETPAKSAGKKKGAKQTTKAAQQGSDEPKQPQEEPVKAVVQKKKSAPKKAKAASTVKRTGTKRSLPKEVNSRVSKAKPPKFDEPIFLAKWESERARSPAVGKLSPGDKLSKSYCGVDVNVTYRKGHVEWDGEKWPTLASVKTAVVGKKDYPSQHGEKKTRAMTNWSVPRFFMLGAKKVAIAKKKAEPVKKAAPVVLATTEVPKPVVVTPAAKKKKAPVKAKKKFPTKKPAKATKKPAPKKKAAPAKKKSAKKAA